MDREDVINQLKSLIDDRKSFFDNDGDDEIFRADAKALEKAIEIIKGNNLDEKNIYRQAIEKWGAESQIYMLFEEMSELQKEICKNKRGEANFHRIAEEIADVEIMIGQMKLLFSIKDAVENFKKYKLERLKDRLDR